jgi:hypothetical protein
MDQITVQLDNLTPRQYEFADIIWQCSTPEQVEKFCLSLPTEELRREALSLRRMLIQALAEQWYKDDEQIQEQTQSILNKFRL